MDGLGGKAPLFSPYFAPIIFRSAVLTPDAYFQLTIWYRIEHVDYTNPY